MSIRKRGRSFQVRLPGERARSFPSRAAAERYQLNRKVARSLGDLHDEPPISVNEMMNGYLHRWQTFAVPSAATVARAAEAAAFVKAKLGKTMLNRLSLVEVEDAFVARAADHPNSAKKELELLKRALKDAHRRSQRFDAKLLLIDPVKTESRVGVALDFDQLDRLGSWFPEHMAAFPVFGGMVGMRLGELLGLTDDRVDTHAGRLLVPAALCKERRDKTIDLTSVEKQLLLEQLVARPAGTPYVFPRAGGRGHQPGPWNHADFYNRVWQPAVAAAQREWRDDHGLAKFDVTPFDGIVPHDLRHTAISLMAASGMRPEVIAVRVGHKDGGRLILERYRHLFPDEIGMHLGRFERFVRARRGQDATEEGAGDG